MGSTIELGEYYFSSVHIREVFLWAIAHQKNIFVEAILLAISAESFDLFFFRDALKLSRHLNNFSACKLLLGSELMQDEKNRTTIEMDIKQIFPNLLLNYICQPMNANTDMLKLLVFLQIINPYETSEQSPLTQKLKEIYSCGKNSFFFFQGTQDKESHLSLLNQDTTGEIIMKTITYALTKTW